MWLGNPKANTDTITNYRISGEVPYDNESEKISSHLHHCTRYNDESREVDAEDQESFAGHDNDSYDRSRVEILNSPRIGNCCLQLLFRINRHRELLPIFCMLVPIVI